MRLTLLFFLLRHIPVFSKFLLLDSNIDDFSPVCFFYLFHALSVKQMSFRSFIPASSLKHYFHLSPIYLPCTSLLLFFALLPLRLTPQT